MKAKSLIRNVLLLFVGVNVLYLVAQSILPKEEEPTSDAPAHQAEKAEHGVVVFYFHGNNRCLACNTIERVSKEAVQTGFSNALETEALEWRTVNYEEPEHRHFQETFQLFTQTLMLVEYGGGVVLKENNLMRIWELWRDAPALSQYVQSEIEAFMAVDQWN